MKPLRIINAEEILCAVKELAISAACDLEPDILEGLVVARDRETSPLARDLLELLLLNADIASRERLPLCQDTGVSVVFISLGQEVRIHGDLNEAVQDGIRQGYLDGYLRKSVCDPLTRINTGTNTPAVIHFEMVPGSDLIIRYLPKGCGSENMSRLQMLPPSAGLEGVKDFICRSVFEAGPNPCPPLVVGVGLGGTFEKAALLAKKSLFRSLGENHWRADVAALENELLSRINLNGQGVEGMGGCNTALAVHCEIFPSHIASLPVAVNIQCHSHRHKERVL
ncbi:MAG: fumarate hydratase [Proteobacteria bacterium]|nr:fumarate hydratase [Pseudomonadota bacterium]MBU1686824.1 fumarate hydratase [Pseudomonadota bacterium]